jgi:hypothetical protein
LNPIRGALPWRIEAPAAEPEFLIFMGLNLGIKVQDQRSGVQHA